jgi:hypothetical protein
MKTSIVDLTTALEDMNQSFRTVHKSGTDLVGQRQRGKDSASAKYLIGSKGE